MKYLQDYLKDEQAELFADLGVFVAFSREQFEQGARENASKKPEGTKWAALGMGMYLPTVHVDEFKRRHTEIVNGAMARDIAENGRKGVIKRELGNYECFYTWDIEPACEALADYGITTDEVRGVFNNHRSVKEVAA